MWNSDFYLMLYIRADQPQRHAEARCANMTARVMRRQRLLRRQARVQRELDATEARDQVRPAAPPLPDCP
jgi:hypothetical protein